jgi:NO-binding membrane sensor protein with MHYT domain
MYEIIAVTYKPLLLALSITISVLGSFAGLMACRNIAHKNGGISWVNAISAAIAIGGVGIWAMHFIGMLAMRFDLASGYSMRETFASLIAAIVTTTFALAYVAKAPNQTGRLIFAGTVLGLGVSVMHYLGMAGMRFAGVFVWNWGLVSLSIVIGIVAATAALWLAFRSTSLSARLSSAVVMGGAVCAMHYTGMAAADIVCTTADRAALPQGFDVIASSRFNMIIIFSAFFMGAMIMFDQFRRAMDLQATHSEET